MYPNLLNFNMSNELNTPLRLLGIGSLEIAELAFLNKKNELNINGL